MRIKAKILLPTIALIILVAAAILISNVLLYSKYVDAAVADGVDTAASVTLNGLNTLKDGARMASRSIAENTEIAAAVASGDRETLLTLGTQLQSEMGVEFCTITDAAGTVIARTHEPENFGDSVASQSNVKSAMGGGYLTDIEEGTAVRLSVRSGSPVYDEHGVLTGVVSVGFRLDTQDFVDSGKALTGSETTVFLGDERISTTVVNPDGTRAIGTKAAEDVSATVLGGSPYNGQAQILGREAFTNYSPILGADGSVVGMLFVGTYLEEAHNTIRSFLQSGLIITFIMLAAAVAVLLLIIRRIIAPIYTIVGAAFALSDGDNTVDVRVNTRDEIRDLADAFNHLIDRNNHVFAGIATSAHSVANGSRHIADGAQALAQGATEQAATVEELSGSVSDISDRTRNNVVVAGKAAKLADAVKANAEKGSRQMDDMMAAVREIHEASQSISNVIKTIDDIAFQTNILALNAAVEAARAGQHGRGFAVVAEEVRNLAAKSAEAASNTETLIANSMAKAETGVRIASETSASLAEIVSGINESNSLVMEIAQSSERQSDEISQVNTGIEQVAQVVQHNSASAQQSAAAADEMHDQSNVLLRLVSQFKLKDGDQAADALPARETARPALGDGRERELRAG